MPATSQHSQHTVIAPLPSPASAKVPPNRIISVVLNTDEDVEWTWTSSADVNYVSGYRILKKNNGSEQPASTTA